MRIQTAFALPVLFLLGCGLFEKDDEDDKDDPWLRKADILFIIDNSASMADESAGLISNIHKLIADSGSGPNFSESAELDYNLAVTTTSNAPASHGFTNGVDDGEAGTFVGADPVIEMDQQTSAHTFQQNVACWATCWEAYEMPSSADYNGQPGDCPIPAEGASIEYVDCLCTGVDYPDEQANWDSSDLCGSGQEHHVEPALLAMCRAVDDPPEVCWDHQGSNFEEGRDEGTNPDWLRDDTTIVFIIVTDEGDSSPLFGTGDADPTEYLAAFDQFERDIMFFAIGPDLDCDANEDCELKCNSGGSSVNAIRRLINVVEETGGRYMPITGADCEVADFGNLLGQVREAIAP
jgi:hypothetical protein